MGAGSHAMRAEKRRGRGAAVGVVLLLIGAMAAFLLIRSDNSSDADDCGDPSTVTVAAAPDIAPLVQKAVSALDGCATYAVRAVSSDQVVSTLVADKPDAPQLWIPDSAHWPAQVTAQGAQLTPLAEAVATTPVVLVGGPAIDAPASWLAAFGSSRLRLQDPLSTGVGALSLAALRAEQAASGSSNEQIAQVLVPMAQRFSATRLAPGADPFTSVSASSVGFVPATESAYVAAKRSNPMLTAVVPGTGTLLQSYPLLATSGATSEALEAGRDLATYLAEGDGRSLVADHDLRSGDGTPQSGGAGVGKVVTLPRPPAAAVSADMRQWLVLSVPSSILVVMDVSGSMDFATPEGSRIDLAVEASRAALAAFQDNARIGLWAFSIDQGGKGTDHRELVPMRRLSAEVGSSTQRAALAGQVTRLPRLTTGGTGLYDTALAAYRSAIAAYDPAYFNSVVLLTDGANDDPDSLRLADLLTQLRSASDPAKPVRIIAVGISDDADMAALTKIAQATNGAAYPVQDPRDILAVLSQALLGR